MNDLGPSLVLFAALGLCVLIFLRLQKRGFGTPAPPGAAVAAAQAGAPVGSVIPLGQNAVASDRQWLLLKVGQ